MLTNTLVLLKRIPIYVKLKRLFPFKDKSNRNKEVVIDVSDFHPIAINRNLSLICNFSNSGYRIKLFKVPFKYQTPATNLKKRLMALHDLLVCKYVYNGYSFIDFKKGSIPNYLKKDIDVFEKNNKDLIDDGILRYTDTASLRETTYRARRKHSRMAFEIFWVLRKHLIKKEVIIVIAGHRTYYLRGLLYRISGLLNKGYYLGPRLKNVYLKKLNRRNTKDCIGFIRNHTDFFGISTQKLDPWITTLRNNYKKTPNRIFETKDVLLAFHVWNDDNFKGNFNLFRSHLHAAYHIVRFLTKKSFKIYYKFHPHSLTKCFEGVNEQLINWISKQSADHENVTQYHNSLLFPHVDLIVTGCGSIACEAANLGKPFLCYADAPYTVNGCWGYPQSKTSFFNKLTSKCYNTSETTTSSVRTNTFEFEKEVDFGHLSKNKTNNILDFKKIKNCRKINDMVSWIIDTSDKTF